MARMMNTTRRPLGVTVLMMILAACSGAERKAEPRPERNPDPIVEAGLQRYREPFQQPRTVIADELDVVISPNFFDNSIGLPGIDPEKHQATRTPSAGGTEYRWINKTGGTTFPLKLVVCRQDYVILREARLRVLAGSGPVTFRVTAGGGGVQIVEGTQTRTVKELRIEDGVVRVP